MHSNKKAILLTLVSATFLAACQDLVVPNTNAPDRRRALSSPADVETLVASTFRDMWGRLHNSGSSVNVMPLIAEEMSGTYANNAALELSSEPRVPLNNSQLSDAHGTGQFQWQDWYKAISSAADGLGAINGGLRITEGTQDNTTRAWAYGKWMQGIGHGYLSMLFDQAFILNEDTELENPDLVPLLEWPLVRDTAIKYLLQSIDTMKARPFTLPDSWIPTRAYSSDELVRLGHSMIARFLVYGARTPEERAAVDWQRVIEHVNQGITSDFEIDLASGVITSALYARMQTVGTFVAYGDGRLVGPADVSGTFANWLNSSLSDRDRFLITTPDRRITGETPTSNGAYFRYRPTNPFSPERGTYHQGYYQWYRHVYQYGATTISTTGVAKMMTVDEMNLLKAEAYARTGQGQQAADLVNITRTRPQRLEGTGTPVDNLPPITAAGVPQSDACVPRLDGVTCADLLGAIMYERMIEGALLDALRAYVDSRGWGRLPEGTFLQFPIPGVELNALGREVYSFGGVGGPSAAVCNMPLCK